VIKRYLIKKLFIPLLLIAIIFGALQNNYIQNKLINSFLPSGYSINISKIKGLFPLSFSTEKVKVMSKDFDINIENLNFQISKELVHIKNINIDKIEVITNGNNSEFSINDIRYFALLFGQKIIQNISINTLVVNDKIFQNINFHYDKTKKENYLKADSPYGKISISWRINKNQILADLNLNKNNIKCSYEFNNKHLNLDYNFKDKHIYFDGNFTNKSLKGIITFPYDIKFESNLYFEKNTLKIELENKKFGISMNSRFDINNFLIFIDKMTFRDILKIKPFVIKDFSKISDIIILLKKGLIKISGINFSEEKFSLGNFVFQNIDLSQFQKLNCSGILNGSAEYKNNHELIKLKLNDVIYNSIKTQLIEINANYQKDILSGNILFNISKLKNQADFKISLQNWLPFDKSKIENVSRGTLHIENYKLQNKQILSGDISYNIKALGSLREPDLRGEIFFKKGIYINPIYGIYIKNISLNGKISEGNFIISNISAEDDLKKKGNIKGNGRINWKDTGNAVISLKIDNLKLIDQNYLKGRLFGNLNLKGNIFKSISITGNLYANSPVLDISGIILMASRNIDILDNVYSAKKTSKNEFPVPSLPIKIPVNVDFKFNPELQIVGFGIESTWVGGASIKGDISNIKYEMNIKMKQGKLDLIDNSVFKLKNGLILINNAKNDISLSAEKKIEKIMVGAKFQQINDSSKISFYSKPYLSDKDIMSYMLFDKPTSEISAGEGLALFSAMNKLSGHTNFDIFNKMKTIFGVDSISIKKNTDSNKEEYSAISIGKKIGKFKVSIDQGVGSDTTGVVVETDIAKNVKMSVDLTRRDAATAGILWSKRY